MASYRKKTEKKDHSFVLGFDPAPGGLFYRDSAAGRRKTTYQAASGDNAG